MKCACSLATAMQRKRVEEAASVKWSSNASYSFTCKYPFTNTWKVLETATIRHFKSAAASAPEGSPIMPWLPACTYSRLGNTDFQCSPDSLGARSRTRHHWFGAAVGPLAGRSEHHSLLEVVPGRLKPIDLPVHQSMLPLRMPCKLGGTWCACKGHRGIFRTASRGFQKGF